MKCKPILLYILSILCVTAAAESSDTTSSTLINSLHKKALLLLAKYHLTPVDTSSTYREPELNIPLEKTFILEASKWGYMQEVSEKIGLNPSLYFGKRVILMNYILQDSTQVNSQVTAHFLFYDSSLVGACLRLDLYAPSVVALNDRSELKPKKFIFPIFNPDLLGSISIVGPWDKSGNCCWVNRVNLVTKKKNHFYVKPFLQVKKLMLPKLIIV